MPLPPALDPGVERQIGDVVGFVREVLRDAAMAAYLYGSAVDAGVRADSDLDILVVADRRLAEDERRSLIHGLLERSRSREHRDRRHLEVTVVVLEDVRPWRYPPRLELQYGDWWRTEFLAGELTPWTSPNPDLAVLLTTVRDASVPLVGPAAAELLDPVPRSDLERALRDVIPELLPGLEEDDTRNSLLTLARIWYTLKEGPITSKDAAADWAIARLAPDAGAALRLARDGYLGVTRDVWDEPAKAAAHLDADRIQAAIGRI